MSYTILGPLALGGQALPLYSSLVSAGFPSPAADHIEAEISLDELLNLRAPHMYIAQAVGDSMIGIGIFDRDWLVVDRSLEVVSGDIVIAALNNDPLVKRFHRHGQQIILHAENPAYPPRYILEGDELRIWGVVTDSIRRHRHHG
ncbi:translesion error-prone DNA polymerase V autoproteolytic subunit [Pseudomonas sp. LS44]|uniref:LexA family protein n=1 Tax=Pseudomonas sp. LS44 TaxID=1357074 RepID=UPI00215A2C7E|nr:S24 family peptidase [Pseudomonas sp. LS44]UVE19159.1 translesion error-prone DNA polymerase V autoproteolytic subunit [Pseudomonas sp. LS44]